jgi:CheY-like chemotaxis protein
MPGGEQMKDELRLAERTAAGAGVSPAQASPTGNTHPKSNLMVVDDQPDNLNLLEDLLMQLGHAVRSFSRGRLALDAAARSLPDLILLDINMPENYSPSRVHFAVKRLPAPQPGTILEDDVVTEDGSLTVISKGTTLTVTLIERIRNFARTRGVRDPIQVRAPRSSYVDELQRLRR